MSELWKPLVKILDEIGKASGCHRFPNRSFFYKGYQFPVCARCTGVFFGEITAVLLALFKKNLSIPFSAVFLVIMGADWGIQEAGIKESTNYRRAITGFLGGLGLFSLYIRLLQKCISIVSFFRSNPSKMHFPCRTDKPDS